MTGICDVWASEYVLTQENLSSQVPSSSYSTTYPFIDSSLQVYRNGLKQRPTIDFTVTGPNSFTFDASVEIGPDDDIDVIYSAL